MDSILSEALGAWKRNSAWRRAGVECRVGPVSAGVPTAEPFSTLPRRLGLWDAFFLSLGTVIGSGVFLTPHTIAQQLPAPGWILVVWVVAGVLSLMGALSVAE